MPSPPPLLPVAEDLRHLPDFTYECIIQILHPYDVKRQPLAGCERPAEAIQWSAAFDRGSLMAQSC